MKKPERIWREIYKEMEEERTRKGRWNRKKARWITISPGLAQALRRKEKPRLCKHDGITAKADEIEALQGVLSRTAAVKVAVGAPARGNDGGEK